MPSTSTSGRILIVDDDPGIRETLADFLAGEGYAAILARNVAEARIQLDQAPDLILLDLTVPGGDVLTFAMELRTRISVRRTSLVVMKLDVAIRNAATSISE